MLATFEGCQRLSVSVNLAAVRHAEQDGIRDRVLLEHLQLCCARTCAAPANVIDELHKRDTNMVRNFLLDHIGVLLLARDDDFLPPRKSHQLNRLDIDDGSKNRSEFA